MHGARNARAARPGVLKSPGSEVLSVIAAFLSRNTGGVGARIADRDVARVPTPTEELCKLRMDIADLRRTGDAELGHRAVEAASQDDVDHARGCIRSVHGRCA